MMVTINVPPHVTISHCNTITLTSTVKQQVASVLVDINFVPKEHCILSMSCTVAYIN